MIIRTFRINSVSLKPLLTQRSIFTSTRLLDESSSDEENDKSNRKTNKEEAVKKLNELIAMMAKRAPPTKLAAQVKIPKPREASRQKGFERKKQIELNIQQAEKNKLDNQLTEAATKVAESFGGDVNKTEKELLDAYFSRRLDNSKPEGKDDSLNNVLLGMKIQKGEEIIQTGSEAESKSRDEFSNAEDRPEKQVFQKKSWIRKDREPRGMKFEKEEIPRDSSRAHQVRSMMKDDQPKQFVSQQTRQRSSDYVPVNLFGEQPFKYFDVDKIKADNVTPVSLATWEYLYQRDLKLLITHPPKNIFEQFIHWTEQGKLWKFPIDNEQDWVEEQKYDFSDHVFLERWLEPWCPETGPIRNFMELVCIGLSKNPYLTVFEKQAHIFWYEHYFRSKNKLLIETGVGEIKSRTPAESASA